jgi:predicted DNA-binding antitoxin AbrB/MazE fold protein
MSRVIVALYRGDVLIPLEKLDLPPGVKLRIRIEGVEGRDELKELGYLKLLQEGDDAEELFEI